VIEVTDEERRRIEGQKWTAADGVPVERPLFVWLAGPPWKKRYRLAYQPDGACVFLDERGLCRIHAKFGENAKPLACRIYPYAFHPAGKKVTVSLRFSCPSVVANRGRPVSEQTRDLKQIARLVVPDNAAETPPPLVSIREKVDWPDFLRLVSALDETLAQPGVPIVVKLLRALFWIKLVGQSQFDKIRGGRLDDLLALLMQAAESEVPLDLNPLGEPGGIARMHFRMLCGHYARRDTLVEAAGGWRGRWKLLRMGWRLARGKGEIPPLQPVFAGGESVGGFHRNPLVSADNVANGGYQRVSEKPASTSGQAAATGVTFAALEAPCGVPGDAEEIFSRYFRVKIQGIAFCGPAYYDVPLVEGFQSLALVYPAVLWLARWLAAGAGRDKLEANDVTRALAIADHHHGYSPAFGQGAFRRRVRTLAQWGEIEKLCAWYSR
jgi:lysine-N-methylase